MRFFYKKPLTTLVIWEILYRLSIVFFYRHITIFNDSSGYKMLAQLIADGDLSGYDGSRSPGYPILLALLGNHPVLLIGLQMILGIGGLVLVFKNLRLLKFSSASALTIAYHLTACFMLFFMKPAS